jgi:serine/threonine protein kinase
MCRITHTDLKPDNILIHRSQQGQLRVCLIDFELSIRDKSKDDYNTYLINKCWMLKQSYASELISAQRFEFAMCFDFLRLLSACHWSYQEIHTLPSEVNTILLYKQSTIQYDYGKLLTQAWYEKFLSNIQDVLGVV